LPTEKFWIGKMGRARSRAAKLREADIQAKSLFRFFIPQLPRPEARKPEPNPNQAWTNLGSDPFSVFSELVGMNSKSSR
jgi:hypothetical protein